MFGNSFHIYLDVWILLPFLFGYLETLCLTTSNQEHTLNQSIDRSICFMPSSTVSRLPLLSPWQFPFPTEAIEEAVVATAGE